METAVAVAAPTGVVPSRESQAFDLLQRQGKMLANSTIVPESYRGNVADCALIFEIAQRVRASPVLVANNLDIIHGRPSWRSQFLIASVNQSGRFTSMRFEFEGDGKTKKCRAWAKELSTGDRLDGTWITWTMVEAEGWSTKKGSKWQTMPDQMFVYRAAAFWARMYAPEISLGFPTADEVHDVIDVSPVRAVPAGNAIDKLNAEVRGETIEVEAVKGDAPGMTYAEIRDMIEKAPDAGGVAIAMDLARSLPDGLRDELSDLAKTAFERVGAA